MTGIVESGMGSNTMVVGSSRPTAREMVCWYLKTINVNKNTFLIFVRLLVEKNSRFLFVSLEPLPQLRGLVPQEDITRNIPNIIVGWGDFVRIHIMSGFQNVDAWQ